MSDTPVTPLRRLSNPRFDIAWAWQSPMGESVANFFNAVDNPLGRAVARRLSISGARAVATRIAPDWSNLAAIEDGTIVSVVGRARVAATSLLRVADRPVIGRRQSHRRPRRVPVGRSPDRGDRSQEQPYRHRRPGHQHRRHRRATDADHSARPPAPAGVLMGEARQWFSAERLSAVVALVLLFGTAAPATAQSADPTVHILPVANLARGERRPLLIFLHGLGGSGAEALSDPGLRAIADHGRMVLVAPDGTMDRAGRRFWNAGGACCNFDGKAVDDLARLEALIDHWRQRPEIDPARVYLVGFSNGGFMAHRLACWMDDRLAAVVSIGGAGRDREEACAAVSSIAVAEVHGDADPIVPYQGGRVFGNRALDPFPSAPQTIHDWAQRLGCLPNAKPKITTLDLDPRLPGAETTIAAYAGCPHGSAELWTIHGGGHRLGTPELLAQIGTFLTNHPKPAARRPK